MPSSNNFMLYEWREIGLGDKCTFPLRYLWNAPTWASKIKCLWERRNWSDIGGISTNGGIVLEGRSIDSEVAQKEGNFCEILFNRVNLKNHDPVRYTCSSRGAETFPHITVLVLYKLQRNNTACYRAEKNNNLLKQTTKNENVVSLLLLLFSS